MGLVYTQGQDQCWIYSALTLAESSFLIGTHQFDPNSQIFSTCWIEDCLTELYDITDIVGGVEAGETNLSVAHALNYGGVVDFWDYYACTSECGPGSMNLQRTFFNGSGVIEAPTIGQIKQFIMNYGPVLAACSNQEWGGYTGGIHTDTLGSVASAEYQLNHSVVIVGWGYDEDELGNYWLVQNSAGSDWGEDGLIKVESNSSYIGTRIAYLIKNNYLISIIGPQIACSSGAGYSLFNHPGENPDNSWEWYFDWQLDPSNAGSITHVSHGEVIVYASSNNYSGQATLKCKANASGGYEIDFTKSIWLGNPNQPEILGPPVIDCSQSYYYHVDWLDDIFDIQWSTSSGSSFEIVSYQNDDRLIEILASGTGDGYLNIELSSGCDNTIVTNTLYIQSFCYQPLVFPNPASTEINVDMSEFEDEGIELSKPYEITIIGSDNRVYKNESKQRKKEKFSIIEVPEGMTSIIIKYKNKKYSSKVLIKR